MELLFNELSVHGQFSDLANFREAIDRIMVIRNRMKKQFELDLYWGRNLVNRNVTKGVTVWDALQSLDSDKRKALLLNLLTGSGPFWDDERTHSEEEYFECPVKEGLIVTNAAVGEAAYRCHCKRPCGLVSVSPSEWKISPVPVRWHRHCGTADIDVRNYWDIATLETEVGSLQREPRSWRDLETRAHRDCSGLIFSSDSFDPIAGFPFQKGAANRILARLRVLDELTRCFDSRGRRTLRGQEIHQDHFEGERAWFSNSSETEEHRFRTQMTFPHPLRPGESLYCPWHGKVRTQPQYRIHFSWNFRVREPLYLVYVGPKRTMH